MVIKQLGHLVNLNKKLWCSTITFNQMHQCLMKTIFLNKALTKTINFKWISIMECSHNTTWTSNWEYNQIIYLNSIINSTIRDPINNKINKQLCFSQIKIITTCKVMDFREDFNSNKIYHRFNLRHRNRVWTK